MDAQLKRKWIAALRGGKFKQMIGSLEKRDEETGALRGNCCLGVLCRVADLEATDPDSRGNVKFGTPAHLSESGELGPGLRDHLGIEDADETKLIDMNDGFRGEKKRDFAGIATWIEKNL